MYNVYWQTTISISSTVECIHWPTFWICLSTRPSTCFVIFKTAAIVKQIAVSIFSIHKHLSLSAIYMLHVRVECEPSSTFFFTDLFRTLIPKWKVFFFSSRDLGRKSFVAGKQIEGQEKADATLWRGVFCASKQPDITTLRKISQDNREREYINFDGSFISSPLFLCPSSFLCSDWQISI